MRKQLIDLAQVQALNEMRQQQLIGANNIPSTSTVGETTPASQSSQQHVSMRGSCGALQSCQANVQASQKIT